MKKITVFLVAAALILGTVPAYAAPWSQQEKGASAQAMSKASDEAAFHRVGDWFATIGKSPEEKQAIILQRKANRAADKVKKVAAKQKKEMEKQAQGLKKSFGK